MKRILTAVAAALAASPALAHHPMGGATPMTWSEGLLSGLGHPIIGPDHLAFIVLVGLAAAGSQRMLAGPAAFVLATFLGTALQLWGVTLPLAEIMIAVSVVALGALLFMGREVRGAAAMAGFGLAGLFHGWAYGEAVLGAETAPIAAYLLGFALIQFAVAAAVARLAKSALAASHGRGAMQARLAAALCCGVGVAFLIEHLEGVLLA